MAEDNPDLQVKLQELEHELEVRSLPNDCCTSGIMECSNDVQGPRLGEHEPIRNNTDTTPTGR